MSPIILAHLDAGDRIEISSGAAGTPIARLSGDLSVFFSSTQQLTALHTAITDYLANRFAMAPEVEAA